jgi:hypothetical protein
MSNTEPAENTDTKDLGIFGFPYQNIGFSGVDYLGLCKIAKNSVGQKCTRQPGSVDFGLNCGIEPTFLGYD